MPFPMFGSDAMPMFTAGGFPMLCDAGACCGYETCGQVVDAVDTAEAELEIIDTTWNAACCDTALDGPQIIPQFGPGLSWGKNISVCGGSGSISVQIGCPNGLGSPTTVLSVQVNVPGAIMVWQTSITPGEFSFETAFLLPLVFPGNTSGLCYTNELGTSIAVVTWHDL